MIASMAGQVETAERLSDAVRRAEAGHRNLGGIVAVCGMMDKTALADDVSKQSVDDLPELQKLALRFARTDHCSSIENLPQTTALCLASKHPCGDPCQNVSNPTKASPWGCLRLLTH
jgi:hypothetical protein